MLLNINKNELWRYEGDEFYSEVNGHKIRVLLKDTDSKNAHVANYYHQANTYKIKLQSFIDNFKLVDKEVKTNG